MWPVSRRVNIASVARMTALACAVTRLTLEQQDAQNRLSLHGARHPLLVGVLMKNETPCLRVAKPRTNARILASVSEGQFLSKPRCRHLRLLPGLSPHREWPSPPRTSDSTWQTMNVRGPARS
jgi:hypothetical protein